MSHHQRALSVLALLVAVSCGGSEHGVAITLARSALSSDAATLYIDIHTGNRSCTEVRLRGTDLFPSYRKEISLSGSSGPVSSDLEALRAGNYTIAVWALDMNGAPLQEGCTENVFVMDGARKTVDVTLNAL
jgi:hypothetical protein